jgi:hypothetical protein
MKSLAIIFASAAFFVTSLALASDTWILDSNRSSARFFEGNRETSDSVNTGVTRVTGTVKLDANDLDLSSFDLSIYPADERWVPVLSPEPALATSYVPGATDQALLTFKSTRILRTGNGRWQVVGGLSLTYVDRDVAASPSEAYSGPVYGDPLIHNDTREITFVFPGVSAAYLSGPLTPAMLQKRGVLEIAGAARVDHDEVPELLSAIEKTNWPGFVRNRDCPMPSTIGEDYSGASCTGTVVVTTSDNNCDVGASAGEDYSGPQCARTAGNQTTIVLDLKFFHKVSEPSVGKVFGDSKTQ